MSGKSQRGDILIGVGPATVKYFRALSYGRYSYGVQRLTSMLKSFHRSFDSQAHNYVAP